MNSISTTQNDRYHLNTSIEDRRVQDAEAEDHFPILSIKSKIKSASTDSDTEIVNRRRHAWHFLTLGIPLLIEALSLFLSGIIHRETTGLPLRVRFLKAQQLPVSRASELFHFQNYNKFSHKPLKKREYEKAILMVNRLINKAEDAKSAGDAETLKAAQDELKLFQGILEKIRNPKATRKDFNENDWKVVDLITYELALDFFHSLASIFNSSGMISSGLQKQMNDLFGVNYHEAVVAENLSLALAYIEDLDGKKILLPVIDSATGKYCPVEYTIKKTVLGDALPCYSLESDQADAHPWFIIRGTQSYTNISESGKECRTGSLESILADSLDPDCISGNVINKSLVKRPIVYENGRYVQKESLSDIFRRWKTEGKVVNLAGHSLGGTLVNALSVEFFDLIKTAYSFSAAGVSYETAVRWKDIVRSAGKDSSKKLLNFDYEGDIVPAGGKVLIGTHFAVESLKEWTTKGLHDSHVISRLNHDFQISKVNLKAENKKFARGFIERIRIITGKCFRLLLWCFNRKYLPDWWRNRHIYREYAAIERDFRNRDREPALEPVAIRV